MLTGDKCCFNLSLWDQIQVSFPHLHWLLLVRNNLTIGSLLTQLNNTGVKEVREKVVTEKKLHTEEVTYLQMKLQGLQ